MVSPVPLLCRNREHEKQLLYHYGIRNESAILQSDQITSLPRNPWQIGNNTEQINHFIATPRNPQLIGNGRGRQISPSVRNLQGMGDGDSLGRDKKRTLWTNGDAIFGGSEKCGPVPAARGPESPGRPYGYLPLLLLPTPPPPPPPPERSFWISYWISDWTSN